VFVSDFSPRPWPWSVLKDLFKVLGLDDEVLGLGLGLVMKSLALGLLCQFVLEIVHRTDSLVTVSCQCLYEFILKVLIWADFGLVCLGIVPLSQKSG